LRDPERRGPGVRFGRFTDSFRKGRPMGTLHDFHGHDFTAAARRPANTDGPIAGMTAAAFPVARPRTGRTAMGATVPHPAIVALPLAPCSAGSAPDWSLARLSEDRFRLILLARGFADDDIPPRLREPATLAPAA
jgi:hypothetical protein